MGSGSSRNVKPIDDDATSEGKRSKSPNEGKRSAGSSPYRDSPKVTKESDDIENLPGESYQTHSLTGSAEEDVSRTEVVELEREMARLQSDNLDLVEQVQALEERLQEVTTDQQMAHQENDFSVTIQAKDQFIEKQQEELNAVQKQMNILKTRYKRKLRAVTSQLSETKHEWSLQVFEMKQQISQLTEDNDKLQENPGNSLALDASFDDGRKSSLEESCDSRMKIILELSNKVSDQDAKIIALENKIHEQEKLIQTQQRTSSANSKRGRTSRQNSTLDSKHLDSGNILSGETAELNELKSIAKEMKQLKKNKNRGRNNVDRQDASDYRQASGLSRDSGIASAELSAEKQSMTGKRVRPIRVQSAASTMSAFSDDLDDGDTVGKYKTNFIDDQDSWDETEDEQEIKVSRKIELRQISAPKNKKKTKTSDFEYIDNLLTDADNSHFPKSAYSKSRFVTEVGM